MLPRRLFYDTLFDDDMMKGMDADVYLKDGVYHIEVDIPGFNKEDIKIETHKTYKNKGKIFQNHWKAI